MDKLTVLSLEQALSLSHATQRFAHLGWRVIRVEATPSGNRLPGDPNRYVGKPGEKPDLSAYFIGPNAGKESIALNLKTKEGRALLRRIIAQLPVDVFCCNTLPKRYAELGIDYETLSAANPALIWAGLSAMGPKYPDVPGYDPALQALTGYMDITGDPNGPPMLCGVPFVDLKAGDEVYAGVCLALAERAHTGRGSRIDVSMTQAAVSWLVTTIPLLDLGYTPDEVRRNGNEHREFVPVNVYPTSDGHVFLAVGNDVQWSRLVSIEAFAALAKPSRETNEGRRADRDKIHHEIGAVTGGYATDDIAGLLSAQGLVAAPINTIPQVIDLPQIRNTLLETQTPAGGKVRLPPPAVEQPHLRECERRLPFAPRYGQHTERVLEEAGLRREEIETLTSDGTVA